MASSRFNVGLDAGGSKTHLWGEWDDGGERIERRGTGANPNRSGVDPSANVLIHLVEDALSEIPAVDRLSICAGVSGAGREEVQTALSHALRSAFSTPERSVHVEVVHDGLIALDAAYDTGSGIVVIAGTGSVILARTTEDAVLRAGGWGPSLGDPGSGTAVGRDGLRAVAETFDGGADTSLRSRVRDQFDIENRDALIRTVYSEDFCLQDAAPAVIDAAKKGDAVAENILSSQAAALAEQVGWLLNRGADVSPRMTLLGGLARTEYYRRVLRRQLSKKFPNGSVELLADEPVLGALRRARRLGRDRT